MKPDTCPHGELDAVCRACCDPLTVWPAEPEARRMPTAELLALAIVVLMVAVLIRNDRRPR